MTLSMGLDGLPDGFGLAALLVVFFVLGALSLLRRAAVQPKPVPVRSRRRVLAGPCPHS